jgi:mannose-1-phosphate guanylyltransferase
LPASTRSSAPEPPLWAVILAGGIGSRFWPVSTPARPKQLLPLATERPLIRDTVERIVPLVGERLRILAGEQLIEPMLAQLPGLGRDAFMVEPRARGTAPVLIWAAHALHRQDPDAVMASLHADHAIAFDAAFREVLAETARLAAAHRRLFTLGATPTRPETGYGYLLPGTPLPGSDAFEVERFVEKPRRSVAEQYVREGYLWNTGIFVWPVALFLDEIRRHTPELAALLPLLDADDVPAFFQRAPSLSIDHGLLERSNRVAAARASFGWDDVGAWDALPRTRQADEAGNVAVGDAHFVEAARNIAWAEEGSIVLFGVDDLVAVHAGGVTLVAPRGRAQDIKRLLERLPERLTHLDD